MLKGGDIIYRQYKKLLSNDAKIQFVFITILHIMGAFLETLGISLIFPYIAILTDPSIFYNTMIGGKVIELFYVQSNQQLFTYLSFLFIFVYFIKNGYIYLLNIYQKKYILDRCITTSEKVLAEYLDKPYSYFLNINSNEIVNVVNIYITKSFVLLEVILNLISEIVVSIVLVIFMLWVNPLVTVTMSIVYIVIIVFIKKKLHNKLRKLGKKSNDSYDMMTRCVSQSVNGIKEVKILAVKDSVIKHYIKHADDNLSYELKSTMLSTFPKHLIEFSSIFFMLLLILLLVNNSNAALLLSQLSSFAMVLIRLMPSVNKINSCLNQISYYTPSLMKISEEVFSSQDNNDLKRQGTKKEITFNTAIELKNLSFQYQNQNRMVLNSINLKIKKGDVVGFMGESGGGKSTLVDLLLGFFKPTEGTITIDDVELNDCCDSWLRQVGYIPQSIFLLDGTIKENILFNREYDKNKMKRALEKSALLDFVDALDHKEDTKIGERGIRLSGGQRQRIGIARAIYDDPKVLFLDEATSALDNELEQSIMDSVYDMREDKTIIIIAHRLSTLDRCSVKYKVENNNVIKEMGK